VTSHLKKWQLKMSDLGHEVKLLHDKNMLEKGDILFLVSCSQVIPSGIRNNFQKTLVLHASDLPMGRGWSPHVWEILKGNNKITVSLLEAEDVVDTGAIWFKKRFQLEGHELLPEINEKLFMVELELMSDAVNAFGNIQVISQGKNKGEYFRKRTPDDSRLDPHKTIAEQFELIRVTDSERYPAFFDYLGHRYLLKVEKQSANHEN
jgi:methionyl-tRNA formyltransferase